MSTNTAAERNSDERQTYPIPVQNDIFAEYRRLGDAIWLYLFYIDRTTEERGDADGTFVGRVFGGVPRPDADAASALGVCDRTIRNWRERLEQEGFIRTKQTGHGSIIEVVNSRKWAWKRKRADRKESSVQTGKNVPGRAERTLRPDRNENVVPYIDSTETKQKQNNQPTIRARAGVVGWMVRRFSDVIFKPMFYTDDEADGVEELVEKYGEQPIKDAFEVFLQRDGGFGGAVRPLSLFFKNLHGCSEGIRALRKIGLEPDGTFKPSSP